ncbi:hypothetical protein PHYBLDRAFT_163578 [Phycomyces blakesleeanus NRRL 1555(-)]|uniref:Uncharacterized protein n=1 Tax=Phycomyces blakesleeanus (strain ATCC 8743b / DSM 1359 / FGSC 10004 / NBRC 33097 / NRRL 1555) TaxID=763407 RepID=A0A162UWR4_PHYB8|nr:hypothetical protein PHYBLDRAFT_163578 [Phycomyces blakesleeanus NRRL 1555(-)]OAD78473.1 hypothetical protein PHYBLDRAFT_163578 [Phycomyces blakesleeanus NRRL 1555(-)]|eukprot:XP_018296513.1 hypothetical protein PHYBLDRAFT_163578 [Phycomyces blakesleeanus NRRL 1555(-)]
MSSTPTSHLLELQVLTQVVLQHQEKNDIRGSIPYLAKIAQIIDNQRIVKPTDDIDASQSTYDSQIRELNKLKADAHSQLADAYFKTANHVQCEASLTWSVKIWERLIKQDKTTKTTANDDIKPLLLNAYDQLKECYEALGKPSMAKHMETRKAKLLDQK